MGKKPNSQYHKNNVLELRGSNLSFTKIPLLADYLRLDVVQDFLVIEESKQDDVIITIMSLSVVCFCHSQLSRAYHIRLSAINTMCCALLVYLTTENESRK